MICYRDMPRALLPRDEVMAKEEGLPISLYADRPDCFVEVEG